MSKDTSIRSRIRYPYTVELRHTEIRDGSIFEVVQRAVHTRPGNKVKTYHSRYLGETGEDNA